MPASRKLYVQLAESVSIAYKVAETKDGKLSVAHLCHMMITDLRADNPRFDAAKFLTACGIES